MGSKELCKLLVTIHKLIMIIGYYYYYYIGDVRGVSCNNCNINYKPNRGRVSVFLHNARSYDNHLILSHANPKKHGQITCIPKTSEQYISISIGNLIIKDSMQFMNKSLDNLVSSLDQDDLKMTKEFLKNYVKNISENPDLLESDTLGLYEQEIPGVTYEIAKLKEGKKRKRAAPADVDDEDEARPSHRMRNEFEDEVTVEDDVGDSDDDDDNDDMETASDEEFINDDDGEEENTEEEIHLHHAVNNRIFNNSSDNNNNNNNSIYPPDDYRLNPYVSPELTDSEQELYDRLFKLICEKGVFCYEHIQDFSSLEETSLPPIESFYSKLTGEGISEEKFSRAQQVWGEFKMKNLWQYMTLYLIMDVVLLGDVLLRFKNLCIEKYGIDPFHSYTTPGFGWQSLLKMTKVNLELLSEKETDLYLFFEAGKRGGLSVISHRHLKTNIPGREDYDPEKPVSFIMYLDANNLYGIYFHSLFSFL